MVAARRPVRNAVSAGGVVYRRVGSGAIEVVICGRDRPPTWSLPKGTPEPGEDSLTTACREVSEETGLEVRAVSPLESIDYWFVMEGFRVHKVVHFWLMEATGGDVASHDAEFDVVEWVALDEARARLSYPTERNVLDQAKGAIPDR